MGASEDEVNASTSTFKFGEGQHGVADSRSTKGGGSGDAQSGDSECRICLSNFEEVRKQPL